MYIQKLLRTIRPQAARQIWRLYFSQTVWGTRGSGKHGLLIDGNSPAGSQRYLENFDTGGKVQKIEIEYGCGKGELRANDDIIVRTGRKERRSFCTLLYSTVLRTVEWNP